MAIFRSHEQAFIAVFWGLCVYYIWSQLRVFDLMGNYVGGDMVPKLTARTYPTNATVPYYKGDLQTVRHEAFYSAMADGWLFQYGHCAGGFVWWAGMLVQLTGVLRERSRLLHQITGYAAFIAGQGLAISGFYGLVGGRFDLTNSAYLEDMEKFDGLFYAVLAAWRYVYIGVFWVHGAWLSITAWVYLYYILQRNRKMHRQWILRHCMVGFATLMKRITFAMWPLVLTYSPIDMHWLPSSIVKATLANVWIFIAHPLAQVLIDWKYPKRKTRTA